MAETGRSSLDFCVLSVYAHIYVYSHMYIVFHVSTYTHTYSHIGSEQFH